MIVYPFTGMLHTFCEVQGKTDCPGVMLQVDIRLARDVHTMQPQPSVYSHQLIRNDLEREHNRHWTVETGRLLHRAYNQIQAAVIVP